MQKIRRDDKVVVISGKDKGKTGTVLRILGEKAVVGGVNVVKKHQRPVPQKGIQGGIIEKESAIHLSNVAIWNPESGKPDRVGIKVDEDGSKVRVYKSNGQPVK